MYNLFSFEFIFFFLYSFVAIFLVIFIPGITLLRLLKVEMPRPSHFIMPLIVGSSLWVFQGFVLGFLNLRFVTYIYIVAWIFFWFKTNRSYRLHLRFSRAFLPVVILIVAGSVIQISGGLFMGTQTMRGLSFCCIDVSDNLYFLSLSSGIVQNIPPFEPGLQGVIVKNYHYLSNIFVAEISRVFFIPINIIQYQVAAVYLPILLGLTVLSFSFTITKKIRYALWLLFFIYFGGDFIWLLMIILQKGANYFSMSSMEDGAKFLSNPPRSFAIVQFFGAITLLNYWLHLKKNIGFTLLLGLTLGTLVGFKVYVGIFATLGVLALSIFWVWRREYWRMMLCLFTLIVAAIIYFPVNSGAGGIYFTSFWFFESFIVQPYLQLERLELARRIFLDDSKFVKAFAFELLYIVIVVFSLFGTKLIGLLQWKQSLRILKPEMHILLLAGIIPSLIVGFFFQQASGGSNTFNFLVNVFVFGSIYTAATMFWLTSYRKSISLVITLIVVGLTVPRVIYEFGLNFERLGKGEFTTITNNQLDAFKHLSRQPEGLVLIDHQYFSLDKRSPYISYFTGQPMFVSGVQILESHGVNVDRRLAIQASIMEGSDATVAQVIQENKIEYIILGPKTSLAATGAAQLLDIIYQNKEVKILRTDRENVDRLLKVHD